MSNRTFAKPGLADLYRRLTRARSIGELPDADALVALAEGERTPQSQRLIADLGRSAVHADLLRFARALAPESARLGLELEQALETGAPAHRRAATYERRAAVRRRPLRIAAGLAACLVAVSAVWFVEHRQAQPSAPLAHAAKPDRIFAALDQPAHRAAGDRIFRAEFNRDRIFKAQFNNG